MRVGRPFTYKGKHYKAGAYFDASVLEDWQLPTYVRLFGLRERPVPKPRKKKKDE